MADAPKESKSVSPREAGYDVGVFAIRVLGRLGVIVAACLLVVMAWNYMPSFFSSKQASVTGFTWTEKSTKQVEDSGLQNADHRRYDNRQSEESSSRESDTVLIDDCTISCGSPDNIVAKYKGIATQEECDYWQEVEGPKRCSMGQPHRRPQRRGQRWH